MNDRDLPLPLSFRADLLQQLMPTLQAGECCSLIGVSGVGKTNLVRFLQREDVQVAYWGTVPTWVVLIDTNSLVFEGHTPEYALMELMIHRLIREAERHKLPADLIADLDRLHTGLIAQPDVHLALRYLDRICGRLCADQGLHIVFAFDQFEDIWRDLAARLFLNLRYLRDEYKYRLVYLVITREPLQTIRQRAATDLVVVEAFWELFTAHVFGLGMYTANDAAAMIERMARRRGATISAELRDMVITLSGGHPGLLQALFWELLDTPDRAVEIANLLRVAQISQECAKIWNDLPVEEQHLARGIATGLPLRDPAASALANLRLKGIIRGEALQLFSPVFAAYIAQQSGAMAGIVVNPGLRQVWVDGQMLTEALSPLEFNLLEYLARNAGKVCRRDDILRALYTDQTFDTNDERLDTLLRRLRAALGEDARNPRHLITHRGVGVQLVQGRVQE